MDRIRHSYPQSELSRPDLLPWLQSNLPWVIRDPMVKLQKRIRSHCLSATALAYDPN